jgi:CheY-like chemotaxis protein
VPPTDVPSTEGNILVVDDNPDNLRLLEQMLQHDGYRVRSFPGGRLALTAADLEPPDLILLDVNMPQMNGYEVCEQLKSNPRLSGIPVVFLSAMDSLQDKIKGFQSGGLDYISKPFQVEEVRARLETHIKLRRAQQAEHDLLERTLGGTVGVLWDLVQLTSPLLAMRSQAILDIVLWITKRMQIQDPWQYELAARLSLVGCITLPDEVIERIYFSQSLTAEDQRMFQAHPETGARLLSKIPRLDAVAEIIRGQQKPEIHASSSEDVKKGAQILHVALEMDRKICRGITPAFALAELRLSRRFDPNLLGAVDGYAPPVTDYEVRRLPIRDLHVGMVLEKNVLSKDGNLLILKEGTVLTEIWIQRLENFAKARGAGDLLDVRIPKLAGGGE